MANDLHGIHMQQHTGLTAKAPDRIEGLNCAHLALAPHQRHQPGGRGQPAL